MKHAAIAISLLLTGTPVLAQTPEEPSAPPPDAPAAMPNDTYAAPPIIVVPAPEPRKNTGALNPDTPDPTKNTPGSESKN
jgi:hypothetical protein